MLDNLLDITTKIAWILFLSVVGFLFVRKAMDEGLRPAILWATTFRVLMPLLLIIALTLFSMSLVFVEPVEVGVVISAASPTGIRPQALTPGLKLIIPIFERVVFYPIYWQTYTMSGKASEGQLIGDDSIRARTSDGQEVTLDCSIIFRIDERQAVRVHVDWQDRYIKDLIRPVIRGAVRTQVSQFTVEEVNSSSRKDLEITLGRLLQEQFSTKGLLLDQFVLRDITFRPEYAFAVEQKQVALEGKLEKEYMAEQIRKLAEGKADEVRIEAKAKAEALQMISDVLQQNPDLLTYEYIAKISPNLRVMLLPNDTPLILPLPEMDALDSAEPAPSKPAMTSTVSAPSLFDSLLNPIPTLTPIPNN